MPLFRLKVVMPTNETYKWIRIGSILSFIPFVLAGGPLLGYFIGNYLVQRWHFSAIVLIVLILLGTFFSIKETWRLLQIVIKKSNDKS